MTGFDPYHKWLGILPSEQPPHHYRLLGITLFEQDADVISAAADRQMSFIRQHGSGPHARESQRILNELATARLCLLSDAKRANYDIELRAKLEPPEARPAARADSELVTTDAVGLAVPAIQIRQRPSLPRAVTVARPPAAIIAGVAAGFVVVMALGIWLATRPSKPAAHGDVSSTAQSGATPANVTASTTSTSPNPSPAVAPTNPKPGSPAGAAPGQIDLMAKIDPQRDAVRGRWELAGGVLSVRSANSGDLLQIPVDLPKQYVLEFDVNPSQQPAGIMVGLKVGISLPNILIDGDTGQLAGIVRIDGRDAESNEATRHDGPLLMPGKWSHVSCQVQDGGIIIACNGKPAIVWRGDRSRLSAATELSPRNQEHLFLATLGKPAQFKGVVLRPLSEVERMTPFPNLPRSRPAPATPAAPSAAPAPPAPGNSTIDYAFEREFAQRMLDHGARSVLLRGDNQIAGGALQKLPDWPFFIEAIEIQSPRSTVTDDDFADIQRLHGLWSLSLDSDRITQRGLELLRRTGKLQSIKIGPQSRLPLAALRECKGLRELELSGSIEMPAVMELAKDLPRLDWLSLRPHKRGSLDLAELPKLPALQRLTITDTIFTDRMLDAIAQCPKLSRLDLWRPEYDLHDAVSAPATSAPMVLELHGAVLSEFECKRLTQAFPRTGTLFLSNARLDRGAWSQLRNLARLEILQAPGASITDDDLAALPDSLRELNISGTKITGAGFQKHSAEFRDLVGLAVNDTSLNDEGLKAALRVTPALQKLFVGNTQLHPDVFADVARLTFIRLVSMGGVADSDACLERLSQSRSLQNVNGGFSPEAISRFKQAHPNAYVSN